MESAMCIILLLMSSFFSTHACKSRVQKNIACTIVYYVLCSVHSRQIIIKLVRPAVGCAFIIIFYVPVVVINTSND